MIKHENVSFSAIYIHAHKNSQTLQTTTTIIMKKKNFFRINNYSRRLICFSLDRRIITIIIIEINFTAITFYKHIIVWCSIVQNLLDTTLTTIASWDEVKAARSLILKMQTNFPITKFRDSKFIVVAILKKKLFNVWKMDMTEIFLVTKKKNILCVAIYAGQMHLTFKLY